MKKLTKIFTLCAAFLLVFSLFAFSRLSYVVYKKTSVKATMKILLKIERFAASLFVSIVRPLPFKLYLIIHYYREKCNIKTRLSLVLKYGILCGIIC